MKNRKYANVKGERSKIYQETVNSILETGKIYSLARKILEYVGCH